MKNEYCVTTVSIYALSTLLSFTLVFVVVVVLSSDCGDDSNRSFTNSSTWGCPCRARVAGVALPSSAQPHTAVRSDTGRLVQLP